MSESAAPDASSSRDRRPRIMDIPVNLQIVLGSRRLPMAAAFLADCLARKTRQRPLKVCICGAG